MKLLVQQELELRQQTRSELVQNPISGMNSDQVLSRCTYLQAQLQHSFHITEQMSIALSDQLETIYSARRIIKQLRDESSYSKAFVQTRISALQDDLKHVFDTDSVFQEPHNKQ